MPNTLVHFSIQTPASKALFKEADFKWIAIGCIIPDIPWIIQRVILTADTGADPYLVLTYVTVQASLFFSMVLSATFALLNRNSARIFLLLAMNSLLHLVLDSLQTKWANGVHFLAPFSWQLTSFSFFWPEDSITYIFTLLGVIVLIYYGIRDWKKPVVISNRLNKIIPSFLLLLVYLCLPVLLLDGPKQANNHYASTLFDVNARPGKYIELDRSRFRQGDKTIRIFTGERLKAKGSLPGEDGILSVKAHFADETTIDIAEFHVHSQWRDVSSKSALAGVLVIWLVALARKRVTIEQKSSEF